MAADLSRVMRAPTELLSDDLHCGERKREREARCVNVRKGQLIAAEPPTTRSFGTDHLDSAILHPIAYPLLLTPRSYQKQYRLSIRRTAHDTHCSTTRDHCTHTFQPRHLPVGASPAIHSSIATASTFPYPPSPAENQQEGQTTERRENSQIVTGLNDSLVPTEENQHKEYPEILERGRKRGSQLDVGVVSPHVSSISRTARSLSHRSKGLCSAGSQSRRG